MIYKSFDVEKQIWIERKRISELVHQLRVDENFIVADSSGVYSKEVCKLLINYGFKNVSRLAGGFVEWERDGLPVKINNKASLSGSCVCQLKYRNLKN